MSHFGRSGPPGISDTYSLLLPKISFRTTADDLYFLFAEYGKVVDVHIPRDRRTGDSRGFAFVRYKYKDEAHKAVEKLDGKVVDGQEIIVQFARSEKMKTMSHVCRSDSAVIGDTYSLLIRNIASRTTEDDLYLLFAEYGKVVDVYIARDRSTGDSRGFAFVRYKYKDEAHKAVERLDGRVVDGREMTVQFAKYGPNAEKISEGRVVETPPKSRRSRSRSPRRSRSPPRRRSPRRSRSPSRWSRDDYRDKDYRKRSRSRSYERRERHQERDRDHRCYCRSRSVSPDDKRRVRGRYDDESRSHNRSLSLSARRSSPIKASLPREVSSKKIASTAHCSLIARTRRSSPLKASLPKEVSPEKIASPARRSLRSRSSSPLKASLPKEVSPEKIASPARRNLSARRSSPLKASLPREVSPEKISKERVVEPPPKSRRSRSRSPRSCSARRSCSPRRRRRSPRRSRSPRWRSRDDYREKDYRKRSRSRSYERRERQQERDRDHRRRSRSRCVSPDDTRRVRGRHDVESRSRLRVLLQTIERLLG